MTALLWVGLGSALGAPARYLLDRLVQARLVHARHEQTLPWGTLTVNVTGSLLFGLLVSLAPRHGLHPGVLAAAGTGFLGSYTTFSTFTWETLRLVEGGALLGAALNVVVSVGGAGAAAAAGLWLGTAL